MNKGLVVILSGPSGSGKGSMVGRMMEMEESIRLSVSATTRGPREGEIAGVHYHYMTKPQFEELIEQDGVLEYARYCDNYYGTPAAPVRQWREEGRDVLLEIEVQGARQVKTKIPEAVTIFIMPPSMEVLKKRLVGRNTEPEEVVQKRLQTAVDEMKQADQYDYIVVNDDLDDAARDVLAILSAEKARAVHMTQFVQEVLNDAENGNC